jgi:hypothetical protein
LQTNIGAQEELIRSNTASVNKGVQTLIKAPEIIHNQIKRLDEKLKEDTR